jgi:multidrug efflux system outer membrane protein
MMRRALITMLAVTSLTAVAHARPVQQAVTIEPTTDPNAVVAPTTVPEVTDPMLALPADAHQNVESWSQALSFVRERSPDYRSSYAVIKHAEAQTRIALAALLPVVTGTGAYIHNFYQVQIPFGTQTIVTPPPDAVNAVLSASWTPLNARAIYDYASSKRNVTATELSFDDKRRLIAQSLVTAMLATLSSTHVAQLNRVGLRSALERLHLTEARLQFGQGTPLDVDRANADVAAARRLLIDGDESLRRSREALGLALGSREPVGVAGPFDVEAFERAVSHTCRLNEEIENRPDVRAARERLSLARRSVTSTVLAPLPTLGLASSLAYTSAPVLAPNGTFALQAVLTIPFYDGGVRYGQLRDARATEEQALASLEQTRLNAIVTSARARRSVDVARADRDVSKTERDLAQQIDVRTRDAYSRGRGTSLDLVTSAQALRLAEINLAILDFQLAEAIADATLENAECTF